WNKPTTTTAAEIVEETSQKRHEQNAQIEKTRKSFTGSLKRPKWYEELMKERRLSEIQLQQHRRLQADAQTRLDCLLSDDNDNTCKQQAAMANNSGGISSSTEAAVKLC